MSEFERQILSIILDHINICNDRFSFIKKADDFKLSVDGSLRMDAIAIRLQAIGENMKKLNTLLPSLQKKYPGINWDDVIRFRDFISHHYELLDHEIVYNICNNHLPILKGALEKELE